MKKAFYKKYVLNAANGLVASLMIAFIVAGCASKSDTVPEETELSEADLFDGLKDDAASVTTSSADPAADLTPAEDSPAAPTTGESNDYAADNIVRAEGGSDYYYVAVGGESIGRVAHAIYNNRRAAKLVYRMNPELKGIKSLSAEQKVYFDMRKANPRSEFLTKDMIDRYKTALREKIQARREKAEGNGSLAQTTVQKGETLQVVSQRLYGTTRLWTELFLLNQDKIGNFDSLKVGTVIDYYPVADFTGGGAIAGARESQPMEQPQTMASQEEMPAQPQSAQAEMNSPAKTEETAMAGQSEPLPTTPSQPADELPSAVKMTEKPAADTGEPLVKGGIPVDAGENLGAAQEGGLARGAGTAATDPPGKRIRPPGSEDGVAEEEGFFSRNLRRFVYIGFIALIVAGGYYLTRPRGPKNKFSGIQPMPNPLAGTQPAPRPRVMPSSPNRVTVNRSGSPPRGDGEQKTG